MTNLSMLYACLALIGWTFIMWAWMYVTRIPAMQRLEVDVDELSKTGAPLVLPAEVSRVADNYNHLHEQPTIFYALVICATMLGAVDSGQVAIAWCYVVLRIAHSIIQATKNPILIRFSIFALASTALFALFARTVVLVI